MVRKGYGAEYKCKLENEAIYGKGNAIKVAIGGSSDYLIANRGRLIKFIEVKETKKKVYYPSKRERKQFTELIRLGKHHNIPVELWIYFRQGPGKPQIKHVKHIYHGQKEESENEEGKGLHGSSNLTGVRREAKTVRKQG